MEILSDAHFESSGPEIKEMKLHLHSTRKKIFLN